MPPAKVSPAETGYVLDSEGIQSLSQLAQPIHPALWETVLRFRAEGTGFESADLGSNPTSSPYSLFILPVSF